jgi:hypothetical protein
MPISVVCPGCRKRFEVSEKFAGQSGPCPHCKTKIKIPEKPAEEVVVHGPGAEAPPGKTRTATGRAAPKPVARKDAKFRPLVAAAIGGGAVAIALAAYFGRSILTEHLILRAVGLLLVSPPLVIGGYSILRDDELEPYRGKWLYLRAGIVSLVYVILWGVFGWWIEGSVLTGDIWQWLIVTPPFFIIGALVALAALDLDFGSGFFLYSFYALATIILRWLAGAGWIWEAGRHAL